MTTYSPRTKLKENKVLCSNNAKEYLSRDLDSFFQENSIIHQTSCVYAPQLNGVAKRKNRHLLEVARGLLYYMKAPLIRTQDVTFFENTSYYSSKNVPPGPSSVQASPQPVVPLATDILQTPEALVDTTLMDFIDPIEVCPSPPTHVPFRPKYDTWPIALRKEPRTSTRPSSSHPISNFSYQEALRHPGWKTAIEEEMHALYENHTWTLVPLPSGKKLVGCK
ncbi:uncharacterized protein [Aristolochia californica]|uniref:uncharacterized protein n=1 Tax=Aristolochia californica TaxID=171875 RepID=UPI0035DBF335